MFSIGEAWEGDSKVLAKYDGVVKGLMNFPIFYAINDVWGTSKKSMKLIPERQAQQRSLFKDTTTLGLFIDNHDVHRFLHN